MLMSVEFYLISFLIMFVVATITAAIYATWKARGMRVSERQKFNKRYDELDFDEKQRFFLKTRRIHKLDNIDDLSCLTCHWSKGVPINDYICKYDSLCKIVSDDDWCKKWSKKDE